MCGNPAGGSSGSASFGRFSAKSFSGVPHHGGAMSALALLTGPNASTSSTRNSALLSLRPIPTPLPLVSPALQGGDSTRVAGGGSRPGARFRQPVQQRGLRGVDLLPRLLEPEPARAVDLRELGHAAGPRRPLDRERVGADRRRVEVALRRPGGDALAAALRDRAELHELGGGRRRRAQLLLELAQRA